MTNKKLISHQKTPDSTQTMIKIMQKKATVPTPHDPYISATTEPMEKNKKINKIKTIIIISHLKEILGIIKMAIKEGKRIISP